MLEKLRIKITILASLIVTAYAYFYKIDFLKTGYTLIITIIVFYILGGFIEIFLQNQITKIEEAKKLEENMKDTIEPEQPIDDLNLEDEKLEETNID